MPSFSLGTVGEFERFSRRDARLLDFPRGWARSSFEGRSRACISVLTSAGASSYTLLNNVTRGTKASSSSSLDDRTLALRMLMRHRQLSQGDSGKRGVISFDVCDVADFSPGRSKLSNEFINAMTGCWRTGSWNSIAVRISSIGVMVRVKSGT